MQMPLPLLERSSEIEQIEMQLTHAHQGPGRQVALVAKSGSGKSVLLKEIVSRALERGERAVFLPCTGGVIAEPSLLRLFVARLLQIDLTLSVEQASEQLKEELITYQLTDLYNYLAGFLGFDQLEALPQAIFLDYPTAVTRIVRACASEQAGLVLVFDDIDQAGPNIQELARRLCNVAEATNTFILMSATRNLPDDLEANITITLGLGALTPPELIKIAAHIFGTDDIPKSIQAQLVSLSHGLPLPVVLIAQAVRRRTPDQGTKLPTMIQAVSHISGGMTQEQLGLLRTASVVGRVVPISIFEAIEIDNADGLLQELTEAGWLEHEPGLGLYRFSNRIVRQVIYDYIPGAERTALHEKIGAYFYDQDPDTLSRRAVDLAVYHLVRSGQREGALKALKLAIEEAAATHNLEARRDMLKQAIEIAAVSVKFRQLHIQFSEQLGDLYAAQDDYANAAMAYSEPGMSATPLHLLTKLGLVIVAVDAARATSLLTKTSKQLPNFFPEDLKWRSTSGLIWSLMLQNKPYEALREGRNALATLNQLTGYGDSIALLRATLGMVHHYNDEVVDAKLHFESARGGWLARGNDAGLTLLNRVQANAPRDEATQHWLRLVLHPIIGKVLV